MLCVIDMQPDFPESKSVVNACAKAVAQAKKNKEWVAIVEFADCGWTHTEITRKLKGYNKVINVIKDERNGGYLIYRLALEAQAKFKKIKLVGVYTSQCVHDTAKGLRAYLDHPIQVIAGACCDQTDFLHSLGLASLLKLQNVSVV